MTEFVLLTDNNDGTALIACPDGTGDTVAGAAVFNGGGVSAWLILDAAITEPDEVIQILEGGGDCGDLAEAGLAASPVTITLETEGTD